MSAACASGRVTTRPRSECSRFVTPRSATAAIHVALLYGSARCGTLRTCQPAGACLDRRATGGGRGNPRAGAAPRRPGGRRTATSSPPHLRLEDSVARRARARCLRGAPAQALRLAASRASWVLQGDCSSFRPQLRRNRSLLVAQGRRSSSWRSRRRKCRWSPCGWQRRHPCWRCCRQHGWNGGHLRHVGNERHGRRKDVGHASAHVDDGERHRPTGAKSSRPFHRGCHDRFLESKPQSVSDPSVTRAPRRAGR